MAGEQPFHKQMRQATRKVHSLSDTLVNMKLALALDQDKVWAEGLLVFYEVFRFLEKAAERHPNEPLGRVFTEGMARTEAFEADLDYYLGANWKKSYTIRPAVGSYISHLQSLEVANPNLLIAYVYHLYMGLLSGGQILRKKRELTKKVSYSEKSCTEGGNRITEFGFFKISDLKNALRNKVDEIAEELSESDKSNLIAESKKVFLLNNEIIKTIEGTREEISRKLLKLVIYSSLCISVVYILKYFWQNLM